MFSKWSIKLNMPLKNRLEVKLILVILMLIISSTLSYSHNDTTKNLDLSAKYYENLKTWPNKFLNLNKNSSTGKGIKVAILDTEVKFKTVNNLKRIHYFLSNDNANSFIEASTHADQIVSIINSIAPDAEIYLVVVSNKDGKIKENDLKNALDWLTKEKVDIINMSFGFNSAMSKTIEPRLEKLYKNNTVIVAASGNEGISRVNYPASSQYVISVGANDYSGQKWINSNYGTELDFSMPGVQIIDKYRQIYVDGTSFSTAFMSGMIAKLKEKHHNTSNKDIYAKLIQMTPTHKWNPLNGYGTPTF